MVQHIHLRRPEKLNDDVITAELMPESLVFAKLGMLRYALNMFALYGKRQYKHYYINQRKIKCIKK